MSEVSSGLGVFSRFLPPELPDHVLRGEYEHDGEIHREDLPPVMAWELLETNIRERARFLVVDNPFAPRTIGDWELEKAEIAAALDDTDPVIRMWAADLLRRYADLGIDEADRLLRRDEGQA